MNQEVIKMTRLYFKEQDKGYNKQQVDNYIDALIKTYQRAYADYLELFDKYTVLSDIVKQDSEKPKKIKRRILTH